MRSIVVTVEGVLRKVTDGGIIPVGVELIQNFTGQRDSLVYLTSKSAQETEEWLDASGLRHDLVLGKSEDRVLQLRKIRQEWGYSVDLVIEPDPLICAKLVEEGHVVLAFFHPYFARNEWRPGYRHEVRPWDELSAQVAAAAKLHVAETKLRGDIL